MRSWPRQEKLRTETGALVTALRKPNTRGQWGQMQLRKVVELAGMVRHCDFTEQASFSDGDEQTLRPDMVVNLPGGKQVVVDAKAPLQGSSTPTRRPTSTTRAASPAATTRGCCAATSSSSPTRRTGSGMESAPDFVVLFLPGEHLYGAALEADPALIEDAMARRVLIATPTTLLALLHSVGYGWQQERVAESAQAISDLGRELHGRLGKLSTLIPTLGKRLNSTVTAYNETVGLLRGAGAAGCAALRRARRRFAAALSWPKSSRSRSVPGPSTWPPREDEGAAAGVPTKTIVPAALLRRAAPARRGLIRCRSRGLDTSGEDRRADAEAGLLTGAGICTIRRAESSRLVADREDPRGDGRRALPAGAAMDVDDHAVVEPAVD